MTKAKIALATTIFLLACAFLPIYKGPLQCGVVPPCWNERVNLIEKITTSGLFKKIFNDKSGRLTPITLAEVARYSPADAGGMVLTSGELVGITTNDINPSSITLVLSDRKGAYVLVTYAHAMDGYFLPIIKEFKMHDWIVVEGMPSFVEGVLAHTSSGVHIETVGVPAEEKTRFGMMSAMVIRKAQ